MALGLRKAYLIRMYLEVYVAFKRLCDVRGYRRLNEAVEGLMLRCIGAGSLGLPPIAYRYTLLIHRVNLLKKRQN